MIYAPLIGAGMIILTTLFASLVIAMAATAKSYFEDSLSRRNTLTRTVMVLSPLSIWLLFAGIGSAMWLWAVLLVTLGEFDSLTEAMYFTSVTATTLGYGDSLLSRQWRLLSGFIAANGLLLFSLNTAFLFEALRRIHEMEHKI